MKEEKWQQWSLTAIWHHGQKRVFGVKRLEYKYYFIVYKEFL